MAVISFFLNIYIFLKVNAKKKFYFFLQSKCFLFWQTAENLIQLVVVHTKWESDFFLRKKKKKGKNKKTKNILELWPSKSPFL